jgi:hypothetical protein
MRNLLLGILALMLLSSVPAAAAAPAQINYQVMLTDDLDNPLANQPVTLVFELYDDPSGGSMLWTETHDDTTNSIGVVSVVLGTTTPLHAADFDQPLWLQVAVDGDELSPRRELTSAPFAMHALDAARLGGSFATAYLTEAEAGASGSINDPGNPLDWTMLKNVPAGIADGDDSGSGSGDGYSLNADDADPVDAVYVDSNGDVGIGTTNPSLDLHLHRDAGTLSYLHITNGSTGTTSSDGLRIGLNGPGSSFIYTYEPTGGLSFGTDGGFVGKFDADGTFELGSTGIDGGFELYRSGSDTAVIQGYQTDDGGRLDIMDDHGNLAIKIEADSAGEGGRIWLGRDATPHDDKGIDLNGNWGSSGDPRLRVIGTTRSAHFRMDESGDDSVALPQNAISSSEIEDEVGAAAGQYSTGYSLTTSYSAITSRTLEAPTAGYALVIASCQANVTHSTGTTSRIEYGVSDQSDDLSSELDIEIMISSNLPSGTFRYPVSAHAIFTVSAGSNTFYFVGREIGGSSSAYDTQLSVIFIPTEYGTIETPSALAAQNAPDETAAVRGPLTQSDIATERAEARAANEARLQRELEEIRQRLEDIESEMK